MIAEWEDAAQRLRADIEKGYKREDSDRLIELQKRWKHVIGARR